MFIGKFQDPVFKFFLIKLKFNQKIPIQRNSI